MDKVIITQMRQCGAGIVKSMLNRVNIDYEYRYIDNVVMNRFDGSKLILALREPCSMANSQLYNPHILAMHHWRGSIFKGFMNAMGMLMRYIRVNKIEWEVIDYDSILENPSVELTKLFEFVNVSNPDRFAEKYKDTIDPKKRHANYSHWIDKKLKLSEIVQDFYAIIKTKDCNKAVAFYNKWWEDMHNDPNISKPNLSEEDKKIPTVVK